MKPLLILFVSFIVSLLVIRLWNGIIDWSLSMRVSMAIMLFFTGMAHFTKTKGMTMMVPLFIPFKKELVYITGGLELIAAIGLLIPSLKEPTAWCLILLFVLLLPANIHAAIKHIDYDKGTYDGKGLSYLWFRVPLQGLFIVWVYLSGIYL